ncbi:roadblock/LC7 domain-containing protein [Spirillospora sp. CA-255316]
MNVTQKPGTAADLSWLLDDLVRRLPHVLHAIVLSADGLLMGSSHDLPKDDGEHLAAVAAGIQSLAKGASERHGDGPVRQTIVEMEAGFLLVTTAGSGACLAVLSDAQADVGVVAYEMTVMVGGMGEHLTSPSRARGTTPA